MQRLAGRNRRLSRSSLDNLQSLGAQTRATVAPIRVWQCICPPRLSWHVFWPLLGSSWPAALNIAQVTGNAASRTPAHATDIILATIAPFDDAPWPLPSETQSAGTSTTTELLLATRKQDSHPCEPLRGFQENHHHRQHPMQPGWTCLASSFVMGKGIYMPSVPDADGATGRQASASVSQDTLAAPASALRALETVRATESVARLSRSRLAG